MTTKQQVNDKLDEVLPLVEKFQKAEDAINRWEEALWEFERDSKHTNVVLAQEAINELVAQRNRIAEEIISAKERT